MIAGQHYGRALRPAEVRGKAEDAIGKALARNDSLAEVRVAFTSYKAIFEWDAEGSQQEFERAIRLNPGYPTAFHLSVMPLVLMGKAEEAVAAGRRALELDPLSLNLHHVLGFLLVQARWFDEAILQLRKTLELDPDYGLARLSLVKRMLPSASLSRLIPSPSCLSMTRQE